MIFDAAPYRAVRAHGCTERHVTQLTMTSPDAKHDAPETRSGRYDHNEARGPRSRKRICETITLSRRVGPVPLPGPGVSKPALISNRRVITIALELELARVWRGYLVFFSLGAC